MNLRQYSVQYQVIFKHKNKEKSVKNIISIPQQGQKKVYSVDKTQKEHQQDFEQIKISELDKRIQNRSYTGKPIQYNLLQKLKKCIISQNLQQGRQVAYHISKLQQKWNHEDAKRLPEAIGNITEIIGQPAFAVMHKMTYVYGKIFKLNLGIKQFIIISDPLYVKQIMIDNVDKYSKGILSEVTEFVMGQGLIPANGEIWKARRRKIVPSMHKQFLKKMFNLFNRSMDKGLNLLHKRATPIQIKQNGISNGYTYNNGADNSINYNKNNNNSNYNSNGNSKNGSINGNGSQDSIYNGCTGRISSASYLPSDLVIKNINIEEFFSKYALDVIGEAIFNVKFDSLSKDTEVISAVYTLLKETEQRAVEPLSYYQWPLVKQIVPRQRKVKQALNVVNEALDQLINQSKVLEEIEGLEFQEDQSENYSSDKDPSVLRFLLASGEHTTSKQLKDDLMTLLIAGHETTASVLTWSTYLLTQHPLILQDLKQEVDRAFEGQEELSMQSIDKLKFTTRVINESMRLYPQPPVLIRRTLEPQNIGGYQLDKGTDIFISVFTLHRLSKHWENPEQFNPYRFPITQPIPNESNQNYAYLPFGGGKRKCIGEQFALLETIIALAILVRRYDFKLSDNHPQVGMSTGATIHTTNGLFLDLTPRTHPIQQQNMQEHQESTSNGLQQQSIKTLHKVA